MKLITLMVHLLNENQNALESEWTIIEMRNKNQNKLFNYFSCRNQNTNVVYFVLESESKWVKLLQISKKSLIKCYHN